MPWYLSLPALLLLAACTGTQKFTADYDRFMVGPYEIENNTWGKDQLGKKDLTDYSQYLFLGRKNETGEQTYGWSWRWPLYDGHVKAYPEIKYGWKPWSATPLTPGFPKKIDSITELTADFDITIEASGKYNLAFDLWLVSEAIPKPENITYEIMVWVDNLNWATMDVDAEELQELGGIQIGNQDYSFYKGNVNSGGWSYYAFVKKQSQLKGALDLNAFLVYLVDNGYVSGNDYLASIELGNELLHGEGTTTVHAYSLIIK